MIKGNLWILIDNYDSFTFILADYLKQINDNLLIVRNDVVSLTEIEKLQPSRIIISPGPKSPKDAGISMEIIQHFHDKCPILGICLGHQALAAFWGIDIIKAPYPMHGKTSILKLKDKNYWLFNGMDQPIQVMRYHSLCIAKSKTNDNIIFPALSADDETIMVMQHLQYKCLGIQFHPESILTPNGFRMLQNWDKWCLES